MPIAAIAPIAAAAIGGLASMGSAMGMGGGGDGPEKLNEESRKTLGSFASRMAQEENAMQDNQGGYLLRPGGTPIRFSGLQRPQAQATPAASQPFVYK